MLPGNTATTLLSQYLRGQQGVLEAVKLSPDDIRLTVGEKVQATVTNQLPNGRFAVLIKDQLLDLNLPRNTQPGEKLDLTVVAKSPTLTFSLATQEVKLPLPQAPNVELSKGAALLNEVLSKSSDGKAAVLQQAQPLFSAKPDTTQLAGQLAGRLAESGLFYESHQAEWVTGQRPLQTLLREPQASLNASSFNEGKTAAAMSNAAKESTDNTVNTSNKTQDLALQAALKKSDDLPPEQAMRQLVRQQVDLLEQRPLVWQGNAWPGQPLKWELELQNEQEHQADLAVEQRQWQTKLDLTLPKLGEVGVVATMVQGQFSLRFNAVDEKTAALIKTHQADLMQRFEAAGLTLVKSQVDHEGA
ncbi:flagellar hook-length control protein FliK [Deefgea rivuli]|uniref:flagellar hook-length control protein FliK n=1 Tax=Deefgea rivuli TaxID=400948 RepID=UPI00048405C0|nr:flagellar hook-length control protein FliK [Deefgea rivuli]